VYAKDVTFQFTWDAGTEVDLAGYALFERKDSAAYDYNQPLDPDCTIVDGGCYTDSVNKTNSFSKTVTVNIPAVTDLTAVFNKVTQTIDFSWSYASQPPVTYYYVARARDTDGQWSDDSNEVSKTFDLSITHWKLYKGSISGGPYTEVLDLPWDGSSALTASLPASTIAPGTINYFTIVGFTVDDIFSPDSNEIQIDRRPPTKVINLKVTLVP